MKSMLPRATGHFSVAPLVAVVLALSACTNDSADLRDYVAEVKSRPGGSLEKIPPVPLPAPIPVISQRTDPFESFVANALGNATKPVPPEVPPWPPRIEEELERFSLDSLRMVGTLKQQEEQWGLVKDPDGVIHRVKAGNFMGQNHGKILDVSDLRIHLLEKVSDGRGSWEERRAALTLAD